MRPRLPFRGPAPGRTGTGRVAASRLGPISLVTGLLMIGIVQSLAPIGTPPLYDGVIPIDPYRWLAPPAGQSGGAKGATGTVEVRGSQSPLVAIATPEQPPQAQVFAITGTLVMPHGATSLKLSIEPIPVAGEPNPTEGHIAGNVYRIRITDQADHPVTALASGKVTVVLRGPGGLADATVNRVSGGAWRPLKTSSAGFASTFLAVVIEFGDFALIAPGPGPSASSGAPPPASLEPSSEATGGPSSAPPAASAPAGSGAPTGEPSATAPGSAGSGPPLILLAGLGVAVLALGMALYLRRSARR